MYKVYQKKKVHKDLCFQETKMNKLIIFLMKLKTNDKKYLKIYKHYFIERI